MSRDTWQLRRPATRIQKIRKSLTLPAASYECFEDKGSVLVNMDPSGPASGLAMRQSLPAAFNITAELTLECWILVSVFSNTIILGVQTQYELRLTSDGLLRLTLYKGGAQTVIGTTIIPSFQWVHVAATWDGVTGKLFINGVQEANTLSLTPSIDTGGVSLFLGGNQANYSLIAEARIWSVALTQDQLNFRRNHPTSFGVTDLDSDLIGYWKCNEGVGASIIYNKIAAYPLDYDVLSPHAMSAEYPPLIYGASFIVAQTVVTLGRPVSLIFPKVAPTGCTGVLCVSALDDEGEEQRYKLWDLDGVDIAPAPIQYNGQKLNSPFTLEWWNIDGEKTLETASDLTLSISHCTNPTTSQDTTQIAAATITMDTTLAEAFPLTFPLTFASQQTY